MLRSLFSKLLADFLLSCHQVPRPKIFSCRVAIVIWHGLLCLHFFLNYILIVGLLRWSCCVSAIFLFMTNTATRKAESANSFVLHMLGDASNFDKLDQWPVIANLNTKPYEPSPSFICNVRVDSQNRTNGLANIPQYRWLIILY